MHSCETIKGSEIWWCDAQGDERPVEGRGKKERVRSDGCTRWQTCMSFTPKMSSRQGGRALSEKTANVTARKVPTGRQRGEEVKSKIGWASFLSFVIASLAPEVVLCQLLVRLSALILRGAMNILHRRHAPYGISAIDWIVDWSDISQQQHWNFMELWQFLFKLLQMAEFFSFSSQTLILDPVKVSFLMYSIIY